MPRRVRAAVTAQQLAAQADGIRHEADGTAGNGGQGTGDGEYTANGIRREADGGAGGGRPRQLAVPYQNYRRYRG
jgi:hypothetical protein